MFSRAEFNPGRFSNSALGLALLLAATALGCVQPGTRAGAEFDPLPEREVWAPLDTGRFLALGDSYTIGESVRPEERWPIQLAELLRSRGTPVRDPVIIARTGWTTDELDRAIDSARTAGPFELVSLLIGVNNQYRGRSVDEYRVQFRALLQRAIGFAGGDARRVVVLSIPDWGVTPFAEGRDRARIAAEIDSYNAVNREESQRLNVRWIDITQISRQAGAEMLAADGLHPGAPMYEMWARLALAGAVVSLSLPPLP